MRCLRLLGWNLHRRPTASLRYYGVTKHMDGFYQTVMMRAKPSNLDEFKYWLGVLAHEIMHVVGYVCHTTVEGPQECAWTIGTASSDAEERAAEVGAQLLVEALGLEYIDDGASVALGSFTTQDGDEAASRVAFVLKLFRENEKFDSLN